MRLFVLLTSEGGPAFTVNAKAVKTSATSLTDDKPQFWGNLARRTGESRAPYDATSIWSDFRLRT